MVVDMFLKIDGIPGEAKDKVHSKEIDVLAWSWAMTNNGSAHVLGGAGSGKVKVQDISVTKYVDGASPKLMKACCNGTHFANAALTVRKAGGSSPLEYVTIKMEEVFITSVSTGGAVPPSEDRGGEYRLAENVTLNFAKVSLDYVPQTDKGAAGTTVTFGWDIAANSDP